MFPAARATGPVSSRLAGGLSAPVVYVGALTEALNFDGILMGVLGSGSGSGVSGPHIVTPLVLSSASRCRLITFVGAPPFQVVFNSCQRPRRLRTSNALSRTACARGAGVSLPVLPRSLGSLSAGLKQTRGEQGRWGFGG